MEAAWRVIDPVLGNSAPVHEYEPGNWGPSAAAGIVVSDEGWHDPAPEETARADSADTAIDQPSGCRQPI